jgi:hypothetical protein
MTMTDERLIPGLGENSEQRPPAGPSEVPPPPADAGGDIAAVGRDRTEKEKCDQPGCGKMILKKNMGQHKRTAHGIYKRGKNGSKTAAPDKSDTIKEKPVSVDEIVAVVVQMRWPHRMPSDKVMALLEWRAATERFMSE